MARDLIIIGAGGHGREVLDVVEALNASAPAPAWTVLGFVDDKLLVGEPLDRLTRRGMSVLGMVHETATAGTVGVVALGDPSARLRVTEQALAGGMALAPALVHPSVTIGADVQFGHGVVVAAGTQITTNVRIGPGVQVNVGCSLSHDVVLGAHATLSPGCRLTGGVEVGEGAFFGVGAVVGPGVRVGAWARVGAGSVVLHDVPDGETVYGAPARAPDTAGP